MSIRTRLANHPRAGLIQLPAIIHKLPRLSSMLGLEVHILRDDLTGFGIGGNKTRKVDYLFGDAIARGATTLATIKATSFSRNAAAAASACGLEFHVVLPGAESDQNPLSQQLLAQWNSRIHYEIEGETALVQRLETVVADLHEQGKRVYVLHPGGSDSVGALSYVRVQGEICEYSNRTGIQFSHILHSSSSAGTQAGLVVGQCIAGIETRVIGISASRTAADQSRLVRELADSTARLLGTTVDPNSIRVDDRFVGPGYAEASEEGKDAARIFAEKEGILLDHVYTGKAAAALLHHARIGTFGNGPLLFLHTGGNAGVYY